MTETREDYNTGDNDEAQNDTVIYDEGKREWFSQIPNLVCEMNLTPYEMTAYIYFKKIAGDYGACWKRSTNLAKEMRMSTGSLSKAKKTLVRKGLITIQPITEKMTIQGNELKPQDRGKPAHLIRIIDIWELNKKVFLGLISLPEINISSHEIIISSGEIKKIPLKKNPSKKKEYAPDGAPPQTPQNDIDEFNEAKRRQVEEEQDAEDCFRTLLQHNTIKTQRAAEDATREPETTPPSQDSEEQNSNGSAAPRKTCPACQNILNEENKCDHCLEHYGKNWIRHPAVVEHHERGHLWSRVVNRPRLIRIVGEDPEDVARFGDIVEEWSGRGYKPTNLHGMLSVFTDGWKYDNANGKNGVPRDPLDDLLASGVKIKYGY